MVFSSSSKGLNFEGEREREKWRVKCIELDVCDGSKMVRRKESKNCESRKEAVPKVRGKGWQKETKTVLISLAL